MSERTGNNYGRPTVWTELKKRQLQHLMRLKPRMADCGVFLEIHPDTIARFIRDEYDMTFSEFRSKYMIHTRFNLVRKAIEMAESGNTAMMIFCLKNLAGWQDRLEDQDDGDSSFTLNYNLGDRPKPIRIDGDGKQIIEPSE